DPVKLVITNYPEDGEEWLDTENNPEDESAGVHRIPFSREIYIERSDFREEANRKYFRLSLGKEVRLKSAYIIRAESCTKDTNGNIIEIQCVYDPKSKSGSGTEESQRKVKGTLHWVSVKFAIEAEIRLYDRLFTDESPDSHKDKDFMDFINPDSLQIVTGYLEPGLMQSQIGDRVQFQRLGYFCVDPDTSEEKLVFNRTVGLRDTWEKIQKG
ncbi:MAG TPA: glutamine--tRNA ligase, partial [Pricia sp.]|nr:glutamine--tRNA ligase [Pricia sp.]